MKSHCIFFALQLMQHFRTAQVLRRTANSTCADVKWERALQPRESQNERAVMDSWLQVAVASQGTILIEVLFYLLTKEPSFSGCSSKPQHR